MRRKYGTWWCPVGLVVAGPIMSFESMSITHKGPF
jgi:hypothetical protein